VVDLEQQEALVDDRNDILELSFVGPHLANRYYHGDRGEDKTEDLEGGVVLEENACQAEEHLASKEYECKPKHVYLESKHSEIGPDELVLVLKSRQQRLRCVSFRLYVTFTPGE